MVVFFSKQESNYTQNNLVNLLQYIPEQGISYLANHLTDLIKNTENLIICLIAHGCRLPSAAEYKAANPINASNIIKKINKKFKL